MNWYIRLLVIGFLLWDQNNVTSEDVSSGKPNGSSQSNPQASTTTVSTETPILTVTSTAVPNALTSPVFSNVTTATQAPTVTASMDLTSAFTAGPSSSNFTTPPESTQAMSVSPSTPGGEPEKNCSGIKISNPSYENKTEILAVTNPFNYSISCDNITSDTADYSFKLNQFVFNVSRCKPTNINCSFGKCSIPLTLDVPPAEQSYELNTTVEQRDAIFTWTSTNQEYCSVMVNTICTDKEGNGTITGDNTGNVSKLNPYTNYSCNSTVSYNGKHIKTESRNITTKIAAPESVQNLRCDITTSTIICRWEKPLVLNGPLAGYRVTCNCSLEPQMNLTKEIQSHTFKQLEPYTQYTIKVEAYVEESGNRVYGNFTDVHTRTEEGKPSVVTRVRANVSPKHNNEIIILCELPAYPNGNKKGSYILIIEGVKKENTNECTFTVSNLSYLTRYEYKIYYKNSKVEGEVYTEHITTRYNDKALIGFLAFLITITSLALIFVLIKIYKLQKISSSNNEDSIPLTNPDDEKQLLNIEPIPVEKLLETYKKKNADEGRLFLDEFQSIPRVFSKFAIKEARKPCNQAKNRYIDILPYDDNRVVLSEIHGEPGSDYINASYINGLKEPRKYIAAQGPKEETMTDFWRMIWEQKSTIIVMVTRCEESNRNKCAQYWPSDDGETEEYGDIVVKITDQKFFPDYITRKLHVTHRREKTGRDITHIQFTVWPDHGVPDDPNLLLKLRRRINALSNFFSGPIIIHCSAGVGRTGTYITIDSMLEGLEAEGRVDVYGYVVQLRRQRCLMVQVEFQYIFIHKALVEYNQFGETEVSMAELPLILNSLKKKDSPSEPSQLMCEFQRLPSYRNWRPQTTGHHQDNKDKNRFSSVVPYEFNRVQIKADEEPEQEVREDSEMSSDDDSDNEDSVYINASYITGYWGTREILAAQAPLKNTLSEFWQMVFQKKVKAIVMLSAPNQENDENSCAPYWKEKSKSYDNILQVELTSEKSHGSYTERCFEIRHAKRKDIRKVSQFHYEQWGEAIPIETKELLDLIDMIKKNVPAKRMEEQTRHDKSVPLIIHCSDGSQLTGTFSALWYLLESGRVEGVIDVFQTVKNLRRLRSGIVSSFEQYQFLYDVMASTVPAQNGQIRLSNNQDKMEIENELGSKFPEVEVAPSSAVVPGEETLSKPKDDDTTTNGTSPAAFTDVTLRIDE